MNCSECKEHIYLLVERDGDALTREIEQHIAQCADCRKEYEEMMSVVEALKKGSELKAPTGLKSSIMSEIEKSEKKTLRFHRTLRMFTKVAAVALLVIGIPLAAMLTRANAAERLISHALKALETVKTMFIEVDARTLPYDNFDYIDKNQGMITHNIYKDFSGDTRWRIDKGERMAVMQRDTTYLYIPKANAAVFISRRASGVLGWFGKLLQPSEILQREKSEAREKGYKALVEEKNGQIYLTITSKAEGSFINDYTKNKSITTSDNRREYVFDKQTNLLKSLKIYLLSNGKETLIVDVKKIQYDIPLDDSLFNIKLAAGASWEEYHVAPSANTQISDLKPKEFAALVFTNLSKGDFETHKEIWQMPKIMRKIYFKKYKDLKVIRLGEPFQSGQYPGYFVPYEIKLSNGKIKKHHLAIRNDDLNRIWQTKEEL